MKTLNRPMFRYGGPIKEGVMSGIREPKKNGGPMREAQQWNTVGSPVFPKDSSGRAHHWLPAAGYAASAAARFLPWIARGAKAAWRYAKPTSVPRNIVTRTDKGSKIPVGLRGSIKDRINVTPRSNWEMSKNWMRANPGWTTTGVLSAYNAPGTIDAGKGIAGLAWKGVKQAADLAVPDWIWDQDKWEKERAVKDIIGGSGSGVSNINKAKAAIGMPENLTYRASDDATKKGGGVELSAEELRKKNVERYRDIMDIKGMNKDAAYDSLIAASKAISESGDFKGDLKSGKLINQIIQSTSKAFDKPQKTKDAIDTLILKGEIEKDIKASDPSNEILNRLREVQIKKGLKELNTGFAEAKIAASKNLSGQSAIDAAASVASENFKGNLLTKTQLTDVMEAAKGKGEISEQDIIVSATQEVIKGKNLPDGDYTVGDVLITIKDNQVVPGSVKR